MIREHKGTKRAANKTQMTQSADNQQQESDDGYLVALLIFRNAEFHKLFGKSHPSHTAYQIYFYSKTETTRKGSHASLHKFSSTNLPMYNHVYAICKPCPHYHVFRLRCPNMSQTMDILQLRSWCFQLLTSSLRTSHHSHDLQNATKSYQIQISHILTLKYTTTRNGCTERARVPAAKATRASVQTLFKLKTKDPNKQTIYSHLFTTKHTGVRRWISFCSAHGFASANAKSCKQSLLTSHPSPTSTHCHVEISQGKQGQYDHEDSINIALDLQPLGYGTPGTNYGMGMLQH